MTLCIDFRSIAFKIFIETKGLKHRQRTAASVKDPTATKMTHLSSSTNTHILRRVGITSLAFASSSYSLNFHRLPPGRTDRIFRKTTGISTLICPVFGRQEQRNLVLEKVMVEDSVLLSGKWGLLRGRNANWEAAIRTKRRKMHKAAEQLACRLKYSATYPIFYWNSSNQIWLKCIIILSMYFYIFKSNLMKIILKLKRG